MKTAIYVEDNVTQVVLTPETEFEKNIILILEKENLATKIMTGNFYDCRGGWIRQTEYRPEPMYGLADDREKSIILRVEKTTEL